MSFFNSFTNINNNEDDENINFINQILSYYTIGKKYHLFEYKTEIEIIRDLTTHLEQLKIDSNTQIEYTTVDIGKEYIDFLVITSKINTLLLRIADIETSYYYLEKKMQEQNNKYNKILELKPDCLVLDIKGQIKKQDYVYYNENITNFINNIFAINKIANNIKKSKSYKFIRESPFQSVLRYVFTIISSRDPKLKTMLKKIVLNIDINNIKKEENITIEEILEKTNYEELFEEETLNKLQEWYDSNLPSIQKYYLDNTDEFIKRNINYNNLISIEQEDVPDNNILMYNYSYMRLGCWIIDLADYLALAISSSYDIDNFILSDYSHNDYEYNFENQDNRHTNTPKNNTVKKENININKQEMNKLIILSILYRAAVNIINKNDNNFKNYGKLKTFSSIKTLVQLRDMLKTKYENTIDVMFECNKISRDEYINIINKQCILCRDDTDVF